MVNKEDLRTKLRLVTIIGSLSTKAEYVEAATVAKDVAKTLFKDGVEPYSAAVVLEYFSRAMAEACLGNSNSPLLAESYLLAATAYYLLEMDNS